MATHNELWGNGRSPKAVKVGLNLMLRYNKLAVISVGLILQQVVYADESTPTAHYAASLGETGIDPAEIRERVHQSLHDAKLDLQIKAVHQTLADLFGLKANLMFADLKGALAAPDAGRFAVPVQDIRAFFPALRAVYPDGTVLLSAELVEDKYLKEGLRQAQKSLIDCSAPEQLSYISINGIIAHELAHLLQAKQRLALDGKGRELHADFLAGWALAARVIYRNYTLDLCRTAESDSVLAAGTVANTFFSMGDDKVGIIAQPSHGLGEQRKGAISAGSRLEGWDIDSASAEGLEFVSPTGAAKHSQPEQLTLDRRLRGVLERRFETKDVEDFKSWRWHVLAVRPDTKLIDRSKLSAARPPVANDRCRSGRRDLQGQCNPARQGFRP